MSLSLAHNAQHLTFKQFIPVRMNAAFQEPDYGETKIAIKQALHQAKVLNFSLLDTDGGYEVRFKDKLNYIAFLYQYYGDREEHHRFEVPFQTEEALAQAIEAISTAFNEMQIQDDASLSVDRETLRMDFKTRRAYVSALRAFEAR